MVHSHGQVKFHGPTQPGTFQTGKAEVIKFWSAHHIEETGVLATRQELVDDGILANVSVAVNNIRIGGVDYALDANYDSALAAQHNFNNIAAAFGTVANVVSLKITPGLATGTSLTVDFQNVFLGVGADTFGTQVLEATALAWSVEVVLEQKGVLHNSAGTGGFVRGETSVGATADNFGSSVADVENFLEGTILYATGLLAIGGDNESMVDADTTGAFVDGFNITTGLATAFAAGVIGDQVAIITAQNAAHGTSQTIIAEPNYVAQDLQS